MDNKQGNSSCFSKITKCNVGCCFCSIIILSVAGYLIYFESRPLWYQYEEEKCYISDIKYPNVLNSDSNLWQKCDCGNDCKSIAPCIKMHVNIIDDDTMYVNAVNNDKMFIYKNNDQKKNKCTFDYSNCKPSTHKNMIYYLKKANETYNKYYNKTISCYIDNENNLAYMEIHKDFTIIYVTILVLVAVITICICICQCFL